MWPGEPGTRTVSVSDERLPDQRERSVVAPYSTDLRCMEGLIKCS